MKQDNVTDLILDLRYNGGGSVNTAIGLSYLIAGRKGNPFVSLKYNENIRVKILLIILEIL